MSRFVLIILVALSGCAAAQKAEKQAPKSSSKKVAAVSTNATPNKVEAPPNKRLLPVMARVVSVVPNLRFVVIDFTNSRQPAMDQRLSVYRVGQKVAEIKVSGPFRNTTVAADLVEGEARYGDEVKAE
jgi:hypothetical protein